MRPIKSISKEQKTEMLDMYLAAKQLLAELREIGRKKTGAYVVHDEQDKDKKGRMPVSFEAAVETVRPGNNKQTAQYKITDT